LGLTGEVVSIDPATGMLRWRVQLDEPSERWTLGRPVVIDGGVFIGSPRSAHAFDASDGRELWRTDLAPMDWAASWGGIAARPDVVVGGAVNDALHLAALERATGEVRWRHAGRDIAGVSAPPAIAGDVVVAARAPGWLAAYSFDDGTQWWEVALDDAWP